MRDRRYNSKAWRTTRAFVLGRDRGCQVGGPKCNGRAETAHHQLPTSQYPELFFDVRYIVASCTPCNRHGAEVQSQNRANRMTVAHLERVVEEQRIEIERLAEELARYRNGEAVGSRRQPRIY